MTIMRVGVVCLPVVAMFAVGLVGVPVVAALQGVAHGGAVLGVDINVALSLSRSS